MNTQEQLMAEYVKHTQTSVEIKRAVFKDILHTNIETIEQVKERMNQGVNNAG